MKSKVIIGTRGSKLALWQAEHIAGLIRDKVPGIGIELIRIVTTGDNILDVSLAKIGGKGLFTKELETAMLAGEIDLAVHSLKDMPVELPQGLVLAAVTERLDPCDALVSNRYKSLDELPPCALVGTSSLRRRAQVLKCRPDLRVADLRGNLDTRLRKLDEGRYDAIILAAAGLKRLGWGDRIAAILPPDVFLPAVGQGVLAIEARADDSKVLSIVSLLDDAPTRMAVSAERAFLAAVQGGCQVPVGVFASSTPDGVHLGAIIFSLDGQRCVQGSIAGRGADAAKLGEDLAEKLLASGGRELLTEIM